MFETLFPLEIFPQGALSSSVITTVWIGLWVIVFFNLRFGWVMSGLVVPGYLAPLIMVKPYSAVAILVEALVTFWLARFLSHGLARFGLWSYLFGRDRFFALIIISVAVRVLFDGVLFPSLGEWLQQNGWAGFDYRSQLHSFGLIIIALMANQWWKTGVIRGVPVMLVTLGITVLIVRYGLMPWTNFSISNLSYMYEDAASSILASPKSYLILVISAFIASRMNLKYGWEFNGILIPSLLALQWYQPTKILVSVAEALVILLIGSLLLQSRWLKHANIEGARKLLLFFNISFFYKMLLGFGFLYYAPETKISDAYGMGYLLSTLLAVKMHDKNITARMTRAILQTSFTALLVAVPLGFALTFLPTPFTEVPSSEQSAQIEPVNSHSSDFFLSDFVQQEKLRTYRVLQQGGAPLPLASEVDRFSAAITQLKVYQDTKEEAQLTLASQTLKGVGYQLRLLNQQYLLIYEQEGSARGWGAYVINLHAKERLLIEAVSPIQEPIAADAAGWLFYLLEGQALAIGGPRRQQNLQGSVDVLKDGGTFFYTFHKLMGLHDSLQIRGYTRESVRLISGDRLAVDQLELPEQPNRLWISRDLPPSLNLVKLEALIGRFDSQWIGAPLENQLRTESRSGFAELFLNDRSLRRIIAEAVAARADIESIEGALRIDGYLQQWLLASRDRIAPQGSDLYQPPVFEQMLFFDQQVLTPLLKTMRKEYHEGKWSEDGLNSLTTIARAAATLNYRLLRYHHQGTGDDHLLLVENESAQEMALPNPVDNDRPRGRQHYWGSFIFRLGHTQPYVVQVPRPLYEVNSFEYALSLFERLEANALMIAGAHPKANYDGTADIVRLGNAQNLFNLVNQVLIREAQDHPLMVIHSRAFSPRPYSPMSDADILLAKNVEVAELGQTPNLLEQQLLTHLHQEGLKIQWVDGSPETAGYEVGSLSQSLYLKSAQHKQFMILWLSPQVRANYRQQGEDQLQTRIFQLLDLHQGEKDLQVWLGSRVWDAQASLPKAMLAAIDDFVVTGNIHSLYYSLQNWPDWRFEQVIDQNSQQSFLVIQKPNGQLAAISNLSSQQRDQVIQLSSSELDLPRRSAALARFIDARQGWMLSVRGLE